jgi:hypothetical protein
MNPTVALSRGEIRASGPVKKILEVVPTLQPVIPLYRQVADAPPAEPAAEDAEHEPIAEDAGTHDEAPAGEEPQAAEATEAAEPEPDAPAEPEPAPEA